METQYHSSHEKDLKMKIFTPKYALEIVFRISLIAAFTMLENAPAYIHVIRRDEIERYRYPILKRSFLEDLGGPLLHYLLQPYAMISYTFLIIALTWRLTDFPSIAYFEALLVPLLSIPMTGVLVNVMKMCIGRPRPTFLERCYGPHFGGVSFSFSLSCSGDSWLVSDGRKSFPSGHTSLAFACFSFLFLYTAGQLGTFHEKGRLRYTAHLMLLPCFLCPVLIGISRIAEHKHHWEDVAVGGIMGAVISYISYRIYFPSLENELSHLPYRLMEATPEENAPSPNYDPLHTLLPQANPMLLAICDTPDIKADSSENKKSVSMELVPINIGQGR